MTTTARTAVVAALAISIGAAGCWRRRAEKPATDAIPATAAPAPSRPAPPGLGGAPSGDAPDGSTHPLARMNAITGTVKLLGDPPEMKTLRRESDPACGKEPIKDEEVIVGAGGALKNVIVRISKGISGNYEPPMANATLDQTGCMYRPRVQVIMAGQSLLIRNSDQTLHNVHTYRGTTTISNQAQIPGLPPFAKKYNFVGDVLKFKCDVHPWMTGYVAISAHPFFSVTGDDGTFRIEKVPLGTYTVEAWHERFGTKTAEVVVRGDQPTEVSFAFESK